MRTYGGSEFGENDFLLFAENIKELTYKTYHESALEKDESPGYKENVKEELRKYKVYIKEELLDSYGKKSKFKELNDMVVKASKDENYVEVASSGSDEMYDFTGLTERFLKKIGISYVLTPGELNSIRALLESSDSRTPSRTSSIRSRTSSRTSSIRSRTSSRTSSIRSRTSSIRSRTSSIRSRTSSSGSIGRTKMKPTKKKKKPTVKKKKPTKKKKKNTKKKKMIGAALLNAVEISDRNMEILSKNIINWVSEDQTKTSSDIVKGALDHLMKSGIIVPLNLNQIVDNFIKSLPLKDLKEEMKDFTKNILQDAIKRLNDSTDHYPDEEAEAKPPEGKFAALRQVLTGDKRGSE